MLASITLPAFAQELKELTASAIWQAATNARNPRALSRLLHQAIRDAGRECAWVSDYQILQRGENRIVIKAKCPSTPIYGITVSRVPKPSLTVIGGDGLVGGFNVADGEIVSLDHPPAEGIFVGAGEPSASATRHDGRGRRLPAWVIVVSAAINLLVVVGIGGALLVVWRRAKPLPPLDSEIKDELMQASREILPDIYRHPDGFYLVRGRHGKRRIFPWLVSAILYRNFGLKLFEHRAFHHPKEVARR
ncbi:MAG: hypothetical protein D6757_06125 [Alphaproteobacteria bacterium]|nr:MAG: hypothetical protein D6757_06125 [Alphaproteobacteria bacterium]